MMPERGLYIHIPFCKSKCAYCDFYSLPDIEYLFGNYLEAIKKEISRTPRHLLETVNTIFVGGGTPTILPIGQLEYLLEILRKSIFLDRVKEYTIEANPGTVDMAKARVIIKGGANRVSLGVQSLDAGELRFLGRSHDPFTAERAFFSLREAGFQNINVDLIMDIPGQSLDSLRGTLERIACEWQPEHISAYMLSIEDGTPLKKLLENGDISEIEHGDMLYNWAKSFLEQHGFKRYEVSNFAKEGYQCRHNINYWNNGEYLGFGASSASFINGVRSGRVRDIEKYIECIENDNSPIEDEESLSEDAYIRETAMLMLRMTEGVLKSKFQSRFGKGAYLRLQSLLAEEYEDGLVSMDGVGMRLTDKGFLLANQVWRKLV